MMFRFLMMAIAAVVGLVIVGMLGVWLFKLALAYVGYLIVGVLVVGGVVFVSRRVRRSISSPKRPQVRR